MSEETSQYFLKSVPNELCLVYLIHRASIGCGEQTGGDQSFL